MQILEGFLINDEYNSFKILNFTFYILFILRGIGALELVKVFY